MTDKPELLDCPFCGGEAEYDNCDVGSGKWYYCKDCGARIEVPYGTPDEKHRAMWNTRTAPTAEDGLLQAADTDRTLHPENYYKLERPTKLEMREALEDIKDFADLDTMVKSMDVMERALEMIYKRAKGACGE